ncbi:MAG TPA: DNA-processing protein DprA [Candidatus Bathyarchaeia archaeon]|nr:DNA-processing protein DprA [Candidatus Bathyarchaeia archaeon]
MEEKNKKEKIFWHAFNCVDGFGPQAFKKITAGFANLEEVWRDNGEILFNLGLTQKQQGNFLEFRRKNDPEKLFEELAKENIEILAINDEAYPTQLREIASAPPVLYIRGDRNILSNKSIAIVGSRKFTEYGRRVTENLTRDLVHAGLTIVSGLALGIDGIAHRAALDANGFTAAILGTGIDDPTIYPREHFNLAKRIIENGGALITEQPPRTPSLKQNFPARNRIMAGLALGTLVVEAAENSGSLITAHFALEQNREVFAVPGDIFSPQSAGANQLVKGGAKVVISAADILEELNVSRVQPAFALKIFEPKTAEEKIIWKNLTNEPVHIDKISKVTKLDTATVAAILATLEIEGAVRNIGGQNFIKL